MAKGKNTTISGAGAVKMSGSTPIAGGRCAFFEVVKARLFETIAETSIQLTFLYSPEVFTVAIPEVLSQKII